MVIELLFLAAALGHAGVKVEEQERAVSLRPFLPRRSHAQCLIGPSSTPNVLPSKGPCALHWIVFWIS